MDTNTPKRAKNTQKWTGKTPVFLDQKKVAEVGLPSHLRGIFFFFQNQVQDLGGTQLPLKKKNRKMVFEGLPEDNDNLCLRRCLTSLPLWNFRF